MVVMVWVISIGRIGGLVVGREIREVVFGEVIVELSIRYRSIGVWEKL